MANDEQDTGEFLVPAGGFTGIAERPKSIDPNDRRGTEDIGMDELRLPRLAIAQGLSDELKETNANRIEGLKPYDFFNNMTGEVYGRGPLTIIPIRRDVRRIEFIPRSEGGGIRDMNVPKGDPRLRWTGTGDDRKPPLATEFIEFPCLLLRPNMAPEPSVLSIKMTNKWNRRSADQLTLFIKNKNAPIFAGMYLIESKPINNGKGEFGVPIPKNAGFIPKDTPIGAKIYKLAEDIATSWEGKKVAVDASLAPDADDFDPEQLERESQAAHAGATTDM